MQQVKVRGKVLRVTTNSQDALPSLATLTVSYKVVVVAGLLGVAEVADGGDDGAQLWVARDGDVQVVVGVVRPLEGDGGDAVFPLTANHGGIVAAVHTLVRTHSHHSDALQDKTNTSLKTIYGTHCVEVCYGCYRKGKLMISSPVSCNVKEEKNQYPSHFNALNYANGKKITEEYLKNLTSFHFYYGRHYIFYFIIVREQKTKFTVSFSYVTKDTCHIHGGVYHDTFTASPASLP